MTADALIDLIKAGDATAVRQAIDEAPWLASARSGSGESPVIAALYRGHHSLVELLIESGAELDAFAAAATGRLPELRHAIAKPGAIDSFAYDGWTPLHLAAFFGQDAAARLLLDAGADVAIVSRNSLSNTPLHAAVAGKHVAAALLLIARGAAADAVDGGGCSARAIAEQNGLTAVVTALDALDQTR